MRASGESEVAAKLQEWSRRLLDVSHGPLLSLQSRGRPLEIFQPAVARLYQQLVLDERTLRIYLPSKTELELLENEQASDDDEASSVLKEEPVLSDEPILRADEVRLVIDRTKLASALYRLRLRARTVLEEQGVNTLFVTFGVLEWREQLGNRSILRSPLVLVPVQLERDSTLDPYSLSFLSEEEVVLNPVLAERLAKDYRVSWEVAESDEPLALGQYLSAVRAAIPPASDWQVSEEAHLGIFSFHKLAIFRDLTGNAEKITRHPLVQVLAGNLSALPDIGPLPTEDNLDDAVAPADTYHFLDADSSQLEAISAVNRGASLVIQGPPGTGKSQTIANIIAEALARRKQVLFVSDKLAAREVVLARLREHGLNTFCLSLDSAKADKRAVLEQLSESLHQMSPSPLTPSDSTVLAELERRRANLNSYVRALHDSETVLGISAFQAHAEVAKRFDVPDLSFTLSGADDVDHNALGDMLHRIEALQSLEQVLLAQEHHPWWGCRVSEYNLRLQEQLRAKFGALTAQISQAIKTCDSLQAEWQLELPSGIAGMRWTLELLLLLRENPEPPSHWLWPGTNMFGLAERARAMATASARYLCLQESIGKRFGKSLFSLDLRAAKERLLIETESLAPFAARTDTAAEYAWSHREEITTHLDHAIAAAAALLSLAEAATALLEVELEPTCEGLGSLLTLLGWLSQDPRALSTWLDREEVIAALPEVTLAGENAATWREVGLPLLSRFTPALITEAPELAERFAQRYGKITRFFRPGYRQDMARLTNFSLSRQSISYAHACELVAMAAKACDAKHWLDDHMVELTRRFGQHRLFRGKDTDWSALATSLELTRATIDWFGERPLPEAIRQQLLTGSQLVALREMAEQLSCHLSQLEEAMTGLDSLASNYFEPYHGRPLATLHEELRHWQEILNGFYETAEAVLATAQPSVAVSMAELRDAVALGTEVLELEESLAAQNESLSADFGRLFRGYETDWDAVDATMKWTERVRSHFADLSIPRSFAAKVGAPGSQPGAEVLAHWQRLIEDIDDGAEYVASLFTDEAFQPGGQTPKEADLAVLLSWFQLRLNSLSALEEWLDYLRLRQDCREAGLDEFVSEVQERRVPVAQWREAFLKRFYQLWLDSRYLQVSSLAQFRGARHSDEIDAFRSLDRQSLAIALKRLRYQALQGRSALNAINVATANPASEVGLLRREINKRRRHKPVRRLLREIPHLLQVIKPCLLMSPLAVSLYLDPDTTRFDLVIFDEASQVLPEDAIGCIYRGAQLVVAGDTQQLPPTTFFQHHSAGGDGWDGEDGDIMESLLDQCLAVGMPQKLLKWHYRSRSEELIAFSNAHFYGGRLVTFPGPAEGQGDRAIEFVHVPDGVYDRGRSRTNRIEARKVVELAMEHARATPERSLGIVAFSSSQRLAILEELEAARTDHPELEPFFSPSRPEPVFVKSLELVQGDERDIIFFSIGYGRDTSGRVVANFGPVNSAGGERRLNVAVTRAREQVKVVSSLLPDELQLSDSASQGAKLLRDYLRLALHGVQALASLPAVTVTTDLYDSPFEEAVAEALRREGLQVVTQVGCSGYRIDLAIVDPERPGRYILGVECDGATYHRHKTARDRDRLRQQILENLGWRIHRIWSRDWVHDPQREVAAVIAAVERAGKASRRASREEKSQSVVGNNAAGQEECPAGTAIIEGKVFGKWRADKARMTASEPDPPPTQVSLIYAKADAVPESPELSSLERLHLFLDPVRTREGNLARAVVRCVTVESPVHRERVTQYVAECWGFQRTGNRIRERVEAAISEAVRRGGVIMRGDFLWYPAMDDDEVPVRLPADGDKARAVEWVALEEIRQAARQVLMENISLPLTDAVTETARRLGYERTGRHVATRVEEGVLLLVQQGLAQVQSGSISLP